jgi:hypothetical protein
MTGSICQTFISRSRKGIRQRKTLTAAAFIAAAVMAAPQSTLADESGVSFWLPGLFGSLAAVPGQPGFNFTTFYYHTSVDANASKEFEIGGRVVAGVNGRADVGFMVSSYIFEQPVLGAQASVSLMALAGRNTVGVSAVLTGPQGNTVSGAREDSVSGFGDLYPTATLKWHQDNNNFMTYFTGDIPVGDYERRRFANLGLGHSAVDGGVGYTYFDPKSGHEFSAVMGLTYNFINPSTDYQSGVDFHLDWGASQFFSKQFFAGAAGYVYQQVTGDSGSGARLGSFESRVIGVGPQVGFIVPSKDFQTFIGLKAYFEFENQNRPDGWNAWLTLSFSPPPAMQAEKSMKD